MQYFELILTVSVLICAFFFMLNRFKPTAWSQGIGSYFPVLLFVLLVRSFVFQPFKVVSGSLEPTVLVGDYLAVNQSAYGLKLPVLHKKIINVGTPKLGDIALFYYPNDPKLVYVKRVIGTPGDHIEYKNKHFTINGALMTQQDNGVGFDVEPNMAPRLMQRKIENLNGIKHEIFVQKEGGFTRDIDVVVPKGHYYMVGDNRDDSGDSRMWGFVPESNLIGRAYRIIMSWDGENKTPRLSRIGSTFKLS